MNSPANAPDLARHILDEALRAVDPTHATQVACAAACTAAPWYVLAVGKASHAMATGATRALHELGASVARGLIVAANPDDPPHPAFDVRVGDHPLPGARSRSAADAIGDFVSALPGDARVLALVSGGATSLMAAPVDGIPEGELRVLFQRLHESGADIRTMNGIRKRVLRWGAGRLAAALAPRPVVALLVSDVLGDDIPAIASGPLAPDSLTAAKVLRLLDRSSGRGILPAHVAHYLDRVHHQEEAETPKPGARLFATIDTRVLLSNAQAVAAAAEAARRRVTEVRVIQSPIVGEAAGTGRELAARLVAWRQRLQQGATGSGYAVTIAGGETTVTLPAGGTGRGGRCQELALAVASELHRLRPRSEGITLLAAGTDGRDGPTDAAGAVVDATTWRAVEQAGRDPAHDLAGHDAWGALDAAGALLRTGPTGTNVNDLIIAVVRP